MSEQAFRVAGPALPIDVVHESGHVSVGWRVGDEFRIAFQDGLELEHACETAGFPDLFDFLLRVQVTFSDSVGFSAIVVGLFNWSKASSADLFFLKSIASCFLRAYV